MPSIFKNSSSVISRRSFVNSALVSTGLIMSGCLTRPTAKPLKILFVCQAGTAKSAIARELFKRRAKERGIAVDVFSRGIIVEDHVSAQLKDKLRADGLDTTAEPAMPLTLGDWAEADILVKFNPLPASVKHQEIRDWTDVPSVNDDYADARTVMDQRIDLLLTEVASRR